MNYSFISAVLCTLKTENGSINHIAFKRQQTLTDGLLARFCK